MPFAGRDEDRLAWPGRERPRLELHDELAFDDEEELVARLTMPASVEPSGAGMEDGDPVHRPDLRIRPRGRSAQRRRIGRERLAKADLSAHGRIVDEKEDPP